MDFLAWYISWQVAIISNVIAIGFLVLNYKSKSLLHPGLYYLFTWLLSLVSFLIAVTAGLERHLIVNTSYLQEIFYLVAITNISIIFFALKGKRIIVNNYIEFNWYIPEKLFFWFSYFYLAYALFTFFSAGFNVAENRLASIEATRVIVSSGTRLSILQLIINVILLLRFPFLIYAGFLFLRVTYKKAIYLGIIFYSY